MGEEIVLFQPEGKNQKGLIKICRWTYFFSILPRDVASIVYFNQVSGAWAPESKLK